MFPFALQCTSPMQESFSQQAPSEYTPHVMKRKSSYKFAQNCLFLNYKAWSS